MKAKKEPEEKKKVGRPSPYNPEKHPQQAGELALSGKTDKEIAEALNISESTLNLWKLEHGEFSESLNKNKDIVDSGVVKSLLQRALGYEYTEIKTTDYGDGEGRKIETTVKKVSPDVTACIFWLKNRQKKDWRDKYEQEITGKDGAPLNPKQMSDEDIIALIRKERETNKKK